MRSLSARPRGPLAGSRQAARQLGLSPAASGPPSAPAGSCSPARTEHRRGKAGRSPNPTPLPLSRREDVFRAAARTGPRPASACPGSVASQRRRRRGVSVVCPRALLPALAPGAAGLSPQGPVVGRGVCPARPGSRCPRGDGSGTRRLGGSRARWGRDGGERAHQPARHALPEAGQSRGGRGSQLIWAAERGELQPRASSPGRRAGL